MRCLKYACACAAIAVLLMLHMVLPESRDVSESHSGSPRAAHRILGEGYYSPEEIKNVKRPRAAASVAELVTFAKSNPESDFADEALVLAADRRARSAGPSSLDFAEEATELLNTIAAKYSDAAFFNMFRLPASSSRDEQADLASYREYLADHPNFSADIAVRIRARLHEKLGKRGEGIDLLERYVDKFPAGRWGSEDAEFSRRSDHRRRTHRTAHHISYELARMYYMDKRYKKAQDVLRRAIKAFPYSRFDVVYYDLLARICEKTGNRAEEKHSLGTVKSIFEQKKALAMFAPSREWVDVLASAPAWIRVRPLAAIEKRLQELDEGR